MDYRQQVVQQLDRTVSADRLYSFRQQFADQWYDLHNPEQTAAPMTVSFPTTREDFPSNVENLFTQQLALYFVLAEGTTLGPVPMALSFAGQSFPTAVAGQAAPTPEGIISTRLGNGAGWMPLLGRAPVGDWSLTLPDTGEVRNLFASDAIEDILFVITYTGRTPAWPL